MDFFWLVIIFFAAAFTQGLSGFGFNLLAMPFLVLIFGIEYSAPLVSLASFAVIAPLLYRYRSKINLEAVWRLAAAALVAIPLGVASIGRVNGALLEGILGITLIAYASYALFDFRLPMLSGPNWAYGFGFLSGLLGGAFTTTGPPVIIYADVRRWEPQAFKANLQAYFLFAAVIISISHAFSANYSRPILLVALATVPAVVLGMWSGAQLSDHLAPAIFRKIVLVLLILTGVQLVV